MSDTFLVVDPDARIGRAIADQLGAGSATCHRAASAEEATIAIAEFGERLTGMVVAADLRGDVSGWEMARRAREASPAAIIGYRGVVRHRDWLTQGVPGSIVLGMSIADEIAWTFLGRDPEIMAVADLRGDQGRYDAEPAAAPGIDTVDSGFERTRVAGALDSDTLHALFEKAPSFMAFLEGPEHRYTFANQAYLQVVERASVVGQTVVEAFPEAIAQGFVDLLDHVYRSGETFHAHGIEFRVQRPGDGIKTTFLDLIYHPMQTAGQITGIFVEGIDVTDRYRAQEQVKALQDELIHIARVNALGTLVSALAHELNQPLTAIQNYMTAATMHAERDQLEGPITTCLKGTAEAALRAGEVIRKLREMAARRVSARQAISLKASLAETVALARIGCAGCAIELGAVPDVQVIADRIQIQQVILNLIQNAFEAGNGGSCRILVSASDLGPRVEIAISDSGPGIPPALLPTVFDSFVTTKGEGMGVGLSICRTIVETHGGTIWARNNDGGGASFLFTLPKAAET